MLANNNTITNNSIEQVKMLYPNIQHRRKKSNRKVVIVDYDDTILPSTFVDRWQIENSKDLPLHVSCVELYLTYLLESHMLNAFTAFVNSS